MQFARAIGTRGILPAMSIVALLSWGVPATAATIVDANVDWLARSTGLGVFYKNNFDYTSVDTMRSASYQGMNFPERAQLETTNKLSGRGALKCNIPKESGEGTCNWAHSFDMPVGSQTKNTRKTAFYYQVQIYLPKYILDHRFKTADGSANVGHKFFILQEPDVSFATGEVVTINDSFRGFVGAYRKRGSNGSADSFTKRWDNSPCNGSPEYGWQPAIDAGPQSSGGQTDATSCALFKRRYGPMHYSFSGTNNYGTSLAAQGNPDPDAATNGAVWQADAWNVIEVYVNENTQTVKVWHAKRGDSPKLVVNENGTADIGSRAGNYTGAQLLPRLEELAPDTSRQDTYAIYSEIIASDNFINFPGGLGASTVRPNPPTAVRAD